MTVNKKLYFTAFLAVAAFCILNSPLIADDPLENARSFYSRGMYDEAIKTCSDIIKTYPGSDWELTARLIKAAVSEKKGKIADAADEYKEIIKKYADSPAAEEAFFSVARLRNLQKQPSKSLEAYRVYLNRYPEGNYRALALFNMGGIYREQREYVNALKSYNEILRSYPDDLWVHSWAAIYSGHIYMILNEYDKAIEAYQRVIRSQSNKFLYTRADLHRAEAYFRKKEYETARNLFQQVLKDTPDHTEEALIGLGRTQLALKEYAMAKEVFSSLLEMFPTTPWKKLAEENLKEAEKKLAKEKPAAGEENDF